MCSPSSYATHEATHAELPIVAVIAPTEKKSVPIRAQNALTTVMRKISNPIHDNTESPTPETFSENREKSLPIRPSNRHITHMNENLSAATDQLNFDFDAVEPPPETATAEPESVRSAPATVNEPADRRDDDESKPVAKPARRERTAPPLTMTVEETADALGIGRTLAYELVTRGELPALRLGRRIVIPRSAIEELVNARTTQAG